MLLAVTFSEIGTMVMFKGSPETFGVKAASVLLTSGGTKIIGAIVSFVRAETFDSEAFRMISEMFWGNSATIGTGNMPD
jgi:hypothetical protein